MAIEARYGLLGEGGEEEDDEMQWWKHIQGNVPLEDVEKKTFAKVYFLHYKIEILSSSIVQIYCPQVSFD